MTFKVILISARGSIDQGKKLKIEPWSTSIISDQKNRRKTEK